MVELEINSFQHEICNSLCIISMLQPSIKADGPRRTWNQRLIKGRTLPWPGLSPVHNIVPYSLVDCSCCVHFGRRAVSPLCSAPLYESQLQWWRHQRTTAATTDCDNPCKTTGRTAVGWSVLQMGCIRGIRPDSVRGMEASTGWGSNVTPQQRHQQTQLESDSPAEP